MKKILFVICAVIAMTFASCARCSGYHHCDQDTVVVYDTVEVVENDTVYVD